MEYKTFSTIMDMEKCPKCNKEFIDQEFTYLGEDNVHFIGKSDFEGFTFIFQDWVNKQSLYDNFKMDIDNCKDFCRFCVHQLLIDNILVVKDNINGGYEDDEIKYFNNETIKQRLIGFKKIVRELEQTLVNRELLALKSSNISQNDLVKCVEFINEFNKLDIQKLLDESQKPQDNKLDRCRQMLDEGRQILDEMKESENKFDSEKENVYSIL